MTFCRMKMKSWISFLFRRKSFPEWKWLAAEWKWNRDFHFHFAESHFQNENDFLQNENELVAGRSFSQWKWNESCRPGVPKWESENENGFIAAMKMKMRKWKQNHFAIKMKWVLPAGDPKMRIRKWKWIHCGNENEKGEMDPKWIQGHFHCGNEMKMIFRSPPC